MREYKVYLLDPRYRLVTKGKPIFETNDLVAACSFCYLEFHSNGKEIAIWQPRTGHFRAYYKHPTKIRIFGRIK